MSSDPSLAELLAGRPHLALDAQAGLMLEGIALAPIAASCGTPCWVTGAATIRRRYRTLAAALAGVGAHVHYAVKANDHLAVLRLLAREGAGADVVSLGEMRRALAAGMPAGRIVFSGTGKTVAELSAALAEGVGQINVESAAELETLAGLAAAMGVTARVALRINPDIDAGTHAKITTGRAADKFGIPLDEAAALYGRAAGMAGIEPVGLALHIGSQITRMAPYRAAYARAAALVRTLRGAGLAVGTLDCGGGLAIAYRDEAAPLPEALAGAIAAELGGLDLRLLVEPGRWLVGPAGVLLASVILTKEAGGQRVVVLDAAMNDLARPAVYDAWHGIVPVAAADAASDASPADIVGPVCESADTFARRRAIAVLEPDAIVAILDAGAYGAVMSSAYNARPRAAQVMVDGDAGGWAVIRPRQALEALWADETIPDFLPG